MSCQCCAIRESRMAVFEYGVREQDMNSKEDQLGLFARQHCIGSSSSRTGKLFWFFCVGQKEDKKK